MKGFTVGPAAPSKKCGVDYNGKTKLEKLEKKKLKLEKKIEKQTKKDAKKKCGTIAIDTAVEQQVVLVGEVIPAATTSLQQAMAEAKARQEQQAS